MITTAKRTKTKVTDAVSSIAGLIAAVAYYRMSSDEQTESIPAQRTQVEAWAAKNGYFIIREYIDDGISGNDTKRRKGFLEMIAAAQTGEFQAIICWHQNRFGRFTIFEGGQYIQPLIEANVHLATVAHNGVHDWNDLGQRLLYTMQQDFSNQFLHDLSRDVVRGKIEAASEGRWGSGPAPIGFNVQRDETEKRKSGRPKAGRLVLGDAAEVALVLKIYDLYVTGCSISSLLKKLASEGSRHPRSGNAWCRSTLYNVLTHPAYVGDHVWPRCCRGRYYCARNGQVTAVKNSKSTNPGDQIVIRDNHPSIVSRDVYDRVQERLRQQKKMTTPTKGVNKFYFTGLLFCGHCGSPMHGNTLTYKRRRDGSVQDHVFYGCSKAYKFGLTSCHHNRVKQDDVLATIIPQIEAWATSPRTQEVLETNLALLAERVQNTDSPAILETQLVQVEKDLKTASERLIKVSDEVFEIINAQVQELIAKKKELKIKIKALATPVETVVQGQQLKVDSCLSAAANLRGVFAESDPTQIRDTLSELVESIHVKCDAIPIGVQRRFRYNFVSGKIRFHDKLDLLTSVLSTDLSSDS
jgi:site-specific DNA recombinase